MMTLLDDLNLGKYNLVFIFIIFILIFHIYNKFSCDKHENMADVSISDQIKEAVKQVYLADVEAIRNLSEVATKLQAGGLTVPGQLNVADKISTNASINAQGEIIGESLTAKGNSTVNGKLLTPNGHIMECAGRQHMAGEDNLYLLHKNGVTIGKEWGGTGELNVQGDIKVGKWIISDRGDGLGFYFGDKNNLKYFMWPNGTNLWQSNNQLQSAGDYITNGSRIGITNFFGHRRRLQIDNDQWAGGDRTARFNFQNDAANNPNQFGNWESMRILRLD